MNSYQADTYRPLLENDPPEFVDRVDTPWDQVPDLLEYNRIAYQRIVRDLNRIRQDNERIRRGTASSETNSRGVLVLGEAGTGKTHLLMRVARKLSERNHILFVRKPNNEDAVAQHIWANMVNSLSRTLPTSEHSRSQLDDLLAHVFSDVLIPEFERDIEDDVNAEQRQRWVRLLRDDPYNLFLMLGEGEQRSENLRKIRRRTLRYLKANHPDVDQRIAHALVTYCFVANPDRKRLLLTWLSGQDIDETEAQIIGLPTTWVEVSETSTNVSAQQAAEEQALRAIRTIGILSTHYQPLILAFDQLEGLRGEERLTRRWGDVVREIFTMTPNFLIVTCIFPSLWESWFKPMLDQSAAERISQQMISLEKFGPQHALAILKTHLETSFNRYRLPTSIYPFTEDDVGHLCFEATSPRMLLQKARRLFEAWLDEEYDLDPAVAGDEPVVVTQESIDSCIRDALERFESEERSSYGRDIPIEQDFFGRIRNLTQTALDHSGEQLEYDRASCDHYVMPPNLVVKPRAQGESLCIAVMNSVGNSFAARARNLKKTMRAGDQFDRLIVLRDRRCRQFGPRTASQRYLDEIQEAGGVFIHAGIDEITSLNALYDTLVAVEEHDLSVGQHEINKEQFVQFLKSEGVSARTQFFRNSARLCEAMGRATGSIVTRVTSTATKMPVSADFGQSSRTMRTPAGSAHGPVPRSTAGTNVHSSLPVEVVVGDTEMDSSHLGVVGDLKDDGRRLAISLVKPQCMVVLGYMGSGKSYSLGVLIENALLTSPNLIWQTRPMTVVAFNYRRNPESRFEYGGFTRPNDDPDQTTTLRSRYGAEANAGRLSGHPVLSDPVPTG